MKKNIKILGSLLIVLSILTTMLFLSVNFAYGADLAQTLQDVSVTIRSNNSSGSGVIVTRKLKVKKDSKEETTINFVWTAGHVLDGLRSTRTVIDSKTGTTRQVVEFKDAAIVQELIENGRRVGELKMDAKVIKYSDADNGEDLALLMIRKKDFVSASADFYLEGDMMIPIGTRLFHVGSLLGQVGSNSMTSGIMSKVGRVLNLGSRGGIVFDQSTVTAFPGSSGGGIFLGDDTEKLKVHKGKYIGMLVRGAGEGFNFMVPIRRMKDWAEKNSLLWALDSKVAPPTLEELDKIKIEDIGVQFEYKSQVHTVSSDNRRGELNKKYDLHFLLLTPEYSSFHTNKHKFLPQPK